MYWEETIELIKTHGDEPKSTYPNAYNDSDEYEIYKYERDHWHKLHSIDEFSRKHQKCFKQIFKYKPEIFKYSAL